MLTITIPETPERFDDDKNEFLPPIPEKKIVLEHSLISISKWEQKYQKPYIGDGSDAYAKTPEEAFEYIKCMTVTADVPDIIYDGLTTDNYKEIEEYINSPMTATTVYSYKKAQKRTIITSELIYSWMINLNIPSRFEKWHLNRLLTLIQVCSAEASDEKMSRKDAIAQQRALNKARRAKAKGR